MSIGRDEVLHAARLAEIAVAEEELPALVEQLGRIVAYVEQLNEVTPDATAPVYQGGPIEVPLRADEPRKAELAHPIMEMAPEFGQGFFLVPLRSAMEDGA